MERLIFIDTETTGLSAAQGHRIIEIAAVEYFANGKATGRQVYHRLNPDRTIDAAAQRVHGISLSMLAKSPRFAEISAEFCELVRGARCFIHNARFDVSFLDAELALITPSTSMSELASVTCTMALARARFPGQKAGLDALLSRAGLTARTGSHSALADARLLAEIYFKLLDLPNEVSQSMVRTSLRSTLSVTVSGISDELLPMVLPHAEPYITLTGIQGDDTYNYAARGMFNFPVVKHTMHREKIRPGSWLYLTLDAEANLTKLTSADCLYVGSATQDRMFRGDGLKGKNFHHNEMRTGRGCHNLLQYLREGRAARIHLVPESVIRQLKSNLPSSVLALREGTKHAGNWAEQVILAQTGRWAWNTDGANTAYRVLAPGRFRVER